MACFLCLCVGEVPLSFFLLHHKGSFLGTYLVHQSSTFGGLSRLVHISSSHLGVIPQHMNSCRHCYYVNLGKLLSSQKIFFFKTLMGKQNLPHISIAWVTFGNFCEELVSIMSMSFCLTFFNNKLIYQYPAYLLRLTKYLYKLSLQSYPKSKPFSSLSNECLGSALFNKVSKLSAL